MRHACKKVESSPLSLLGSRVISELCNTELLFIQNTVLALNSKVTWQELKASENLESVFWGVA